LTTSAFHFIRLLSSSLANSYNFLFRFDDAYMHTYCGSLMGGEWAYTIGSRQLFRYSSPTTKR
jgi:hypothetical protein